MHCKKILCVFCCFFELCLCACTAAEPSYITFTQPQAGFTMQVPADWSQQTTVLSAEIIQMYPNGFDAAYVNSCEEAAYVASWNIPGQRANFSVLLIRPTAFDFDLFDAAWRVIDSRRGAYIFTADWTYGDTQAPEIFETMLRSFTVL